MRPTNGPDLSPHSTPRSVHIVDATDGPLVGEGRYSRILPFARYGGDQRTIAEHFELGGQGDIDL